MGSLLQFDWKCEEDLEDSWIDYVKRKIIYRRLSRTEDYVEQKIPTRIFKKIRDSLKNPFMKAWGSRRKMVAKFRLWIWIQNFERRNTWLTIEEHMNKRERSCARASHFGYEELRRGFEVLWIAGPRANRVSEVVEWDGCIKWLNQMSWTVKLVGWIAALGQTVARATEERYN